MINKRFIGWDLLWVPKLQEKFVVEEGQRQVKAVCALIVVEIVQQALRHLLSTRVKSMQIPTEEGLLASNKEEGEVRESESKRQKEATLLKKLEQIWIIKGLDRESRQRIHSQIVQEQK